MQQAQSFFLYARDELRSGRFEIRWNSKINRIYGLGVQPAVNQVELEDFLDEQFSFGHCLGNRKDGVTMEAFAEGGCRLRTPIMVFPEKNTIVAYIQPEIKRLRLSRNGQYGCPANNTCVVMKKHEQFPEGQPGAFIIIKRDTLTQTYQTYYLYLKSIGRYMKEPNYNAFGVNWETFDEFK
jgi:hypothetical protein